MITFDTNIAFKGATTQYLNYDYNSIVKFGNKFLCASDSGLYEVDGTTDMFPDASGSGDAIESYFEPLTMDFGISSQKRLRAAYLGYEADGDLTLKISTELSAERSYTLPATTSGQHARKVVVSRGLKGRYWTFQIYGLGVVFAIDSIKVLPIVRGHGVDKN